MIVIAGKNSIAIETLRAVLAKTSKTDIRVICNNTDTGSHNWQPSLKQYAALRGVEEISLEEASKLQNCLFLSVEFDKIIKIEQFKSSQLYNIHLSYLPAYKGVYTAIWPLLNKERLTGTTLHKIDTSIDTGPIIAQEKHNIPTSRNSRELLLKNYKKATELLVANLDKLIGNESIDEKVQEPTGSSYYGLKSIDFSNKQLNTRDTAESLVSNVRAFAFREYQYKEFSGFRIVNAEVSSDRSKQKPGTLIDKTDTFLRIATIDYDVILYPEKADQIFNLIEKDDLQQFILLSKNLSYIDEPVRNDWTPLMVSVFNNSIKIAEYLLANGADPNAQSGRGTTVLMYAKDGALRHRDKAIFDLCLATGGKIEMKDYFDKTIHEYVNNSDSRILGLI